MNLISAVNVWVSPPPILVLFKLPSQTDKLSFLGLRPLPKILGQKGKSNHLDDSLRATNKSWCSFATEIMEAGEAKSALRDH